MENVLAMANGLIGPLFAGPLDIVGDIHGEIDALLALLHHLGYSEDGTHAQGRRLVFVGDLTDRGPDSPSVVSLVGHLRDAGRVQCILGNHELNILLGLRKHGNAWLHGEEEEVLGQSGAKVRQKPADEATRTKALALFRQMPLALERDDLRVVHACWKASLIDLARRETDAVALCRCHKEKINAELSWHSTTAKPFGFFDFFRERAMFR